MRSNKVPFHTNGLKCTQPGLDLGIGERPLLNIPSTLYLYAQSCLTLCDPMDCSPPGSSVHGDSPGKNTEVGSHFLLQGIFLTQGSNPRLLHCRQIINRWATRLLSNSNYEIQSLVIHFFCSKGCWKALRAFGCIWSFLDSISQLIFFFPSHFLMGCSPIKPFNGCLMGWQASACHFLCLVAHGDLAPTRRCYRCFHFLSYLPMPAAQMVGRFLWLGELPLEHSTESARRKHQQLGCLAHRQESAGFQSRASW